MLWVHAWICKVDVVWWLSFTDAEEMKSIALSNAEDAYKCHKNIVRLLITLFLSILLPLCVCVCVCLSLSFSLSVFLSLYFSLFSYHLLLPCLLALGRSTQNCRLISSRILVWYFVLQFLTWRTTTLTAPLLLFQLNLNLLWQPLRLHTALMNKLVPCAWPSSGALKVWGLQSLFAYLCLCLSLSFFLCLSICLSVCLSFSLYLSIYLSLTLSVCPTLSLLLIFALSLSLLIISPIIFFIVSVSTHWTVFLSHRYVTMY